MLNISNLFSGSGIVMAPIAGFTDSPFRRIARRHGASLVFTELVSAEGIVRKGRKTLELLDFTEEERPIGIQIFGKDPDVMAEAAGIIEKLHPDLIDINLGCCAPKVCASGSGSALLRKPDLIEAIVSAVKQSVNLPVSAKIRTGWDENNLNYMETVKILENCGIAFISVHGRTRAQKYNGLADWNVISEIAGKSRVPIIGNGDISTFDEAHSRLKSSGCSAVMIGRGAIGNPWIFNGHIPDTTEIINQIKCHIDMMLEQYGDYGLTLMRKHIVKYIHGIKNASKIRAKLITLSDYNEIISVLDSLAPGS